ncbi:zf-DHHC-domain-containing protein [Westerdykella ornata]|uniref:Palmitoyltransferase n=1 Tax=Westerdykella ornata TaxID=318751 RepID=A0A6A6JZI9_WESOR|nr:zf-DHHC-domain-containing protein [Westerdykella ornata]KAF2281268.1 zf-DHHC-domain-containing protein [Westerdykella ornata]
MELSNLAVPSVYVLIFFLAYTSQWLLKDLEPAPPTEGEYIRFNILLICLLISYTRSVFVDPGHIPTMHEHEKGPANDVSDNFPSQSRPDNTNGHRKWCRKCNLPKPPRAHHCRTCGRCIPKMDHHCPWTANCVSHTTFPHFLRFLFYAVASLAYLASLLWPPIAHLWHNRNMPSYLGPSMLQLVHLFALCVGDFVMLFALGILLVRNIWSLAVNTTTIEGWEIERHATLVRRARYFGGWLEGPGGVQVRIEKQEFPYDVGIWTNCKEGMGTGNVSAISLSIIQSSEKGYMPLPYPVAHCCHMVSRPSLPRRPSLTFR